MTWILALLACQTADCDDASAPGCPMAACMDEVERWRMAGLYDISALTVVGIPDEDRYTWVGSPELTGACGIPVGPDGFGATEAELLSDQRSSALVILLEGWSKEWPDDPGRLASLPREEVEIRWFSEDEPLRLEPAVLPRDLRFEVESNLAETPDIAGGPEETLPARATIATVERSLAMTGCLEHLVGRAWVGPPGGQERRMELARQASQLDTTLLSNNEIHYFSGQLAPVPALLGPPTACLETAPTLPGPEREWREAESVAVGLHPTGLWAEQLPECGDRSAESLLPLAIGPGTPQTELRREALDVHVRLGVAKDSLDCDHPNQTTGNHMQVCYRARNRETRPWTGRILPIRDANWLYQDIFATLPQAYPVMDLGWREPARAYYQKRGMAVLIVPAWQLPDHSVQAVLHAPEHLSVLVRQPDRVGATACCEGQADCAVEPGCVPCKGPWWSEVNPSRMLRNEEDRINRMPDGFMIDKYNSILKISWKSWRSSWGYKMEPEESRDPVVVFGTQSPTPHQAQLVHGSLFQGTFLFSLLLLATLGVLGLRRLPELWRPTPEVRMGWWKSAPRDPP